MILRIFFHFRNWMPWLDPSCRLVGWNLPGSRNPRYPPVLLLGRHTAKCLFGEASGGPGAGSGKQCCCSVGLWPLPDWSRPLSGSVVRDYTTHHGNIHVTSQTELKLFWRDTFLFSHPFNNCWFFWLLFWQRRKLFPFLLLPTQALSYGDLERDAWSVQYCASQGMELLCAQSFSHCFGLYGEISFWGTHIQYIFWKDLYVSKGCWKNFLKETQKRKKINFK